MLKPLEATDRRHGRPGRHGVQFSGSEESYFCPADARLADRSTLIPLDEVYADLEACEAGFKVLLVDACRNDPQSDNARAAGVRWSTCRAVTRPRRSGRRGAWRRSSVARRARRRSRTRT